MAEAGCRPIEVLVVEDDPLQEPMLQIFLNRRCERVRSQIHLISADEVRAWCAGHGSLPGPVPDMVVVDSLLHGREAADVLPWVLATLSAPCPIVVLSGSGDADVRERALAAGAVAYLDKPTNRHEAERVLDDLEKVHAQNALSSTADGASA